MPAPQAQDLIIIGGGPTGLYAGFYAGLRALRTTILDSLPVLGGQLATLYPEKPIYDVAGFPVIRAKDLAQNLIVQAGRYPHTIALNEQVQSLEHDEADAVYRLHTSVQTHVGRAILIAAGVGAFQPKTLPLPEAKRFEGGGLEYFVTDVAHLRGRRILIVGGGDSAVDWANALSPIAREVTLIHRRDRFRAHEESVTQMRQGSTRLLTFHELRSLQGGDRLESATVYDNRSGQELTLPVDVILVNIGFESSLGPIRSWGLETEGSAIKVDHTMQTNRPGIFAAGDVAIYPGKLKLISVGFGEAAIAVNHAKHFLDPTSNIFPGHSTNMKM